ncbi:MAG: small ribosomal subunit Rsm22 family protein [candidate division WOR-3 bacterium]
MVCLSEDFTHSRHSESTYNDAYFAYNFPQNFMKTMFVANRLYDFYNIPKTEDNLQVLDLGCGEGAGMFAYYYGLNKKLQGRVQFFLTGVDMSEKLLTRCETLANWFRKTNANINVKILQESLSHFVSTNQDRYDIVIIANVLTEIFQLDKIPISFIRTLFDLLQKNGIVVIIEPALKHLTRRLMQLRNELIEHGFGTILLPCLHNNPCPGLIRKNEWCHQSIKWQPPDYLKILNQKLYRKIEYLKFSYVVITKEKKQSIDKGKYLVISRLFREKGRKRCLICSEQGVVHLIKLDRETSLINEEFDDVCLGDIIQIENLTKTKSITWKVSRQTEIKRLDFL